MDQQLRPEESERCVTVFCTHTSIDRQMPSHISHHESLLLMLQSHSCSLTIFCCMPILQVSMEAACVYYCVCHRLLVTGEIAFHRVPLMAFSLPQLLHLHQQQKPLSEHPQPTTNHVHSNCQPPALLDELDRYTKLEAQNASAVRSRNRGKV